jgi:tripartite-type tricarboxylate transporter receptor subunit TctC
MKLARRNFLHLAAGAAVLPVLPGLAFALDYPTRSVRVIVAFAPGGVTDTFARLMAQKLGEHLGKQFYVENIAGATGNIGTGQAAKAAPDGYTLLFAFSSYVVNPTLFGKVPYDPYNDFEPVTLAVVSTTVVTVHPLVPAKTVKELVVLVRAYPGKYSYSSAGAGTQAHLAGEQFRVSLGLDLVHVPFNGGGPAIAAVVGGHIPIGFGSPAASIPQKATCVRSRSQANGARRFGQGFASVIATAGNDDTGAFLREGKGGGAANAGQGAGDQDDGFAHRTSP